MIRVIHGITEDYAAENTAERLQMEQQVTVVVILLLLLKRMWLLGEHEKTGRGHERNC